jgi:hypothetical protein
MYLKIPIKCPSLNKASPLPHSRLFDMEKIYSSVLNSRVNPQFHSNPSE